MSDDPSADARALAVWGANRIRRAQSLTSGSLDLGDEPVPSPRQIAAVLRALADHTHVTALLNSPDPDGPWPAATKIGRHFHGLADSIVRDEDGPISADNRTESDRG